MHRILIVEDHETLGYVLTEYLKMHGFDPVLESSAETALKRMQQFMPDLCLIDVSLPQMDGFELCRQVRHRFPDMPVIFLTARGLKVDRIKGLMLEADDYLVKPVDEEELVLRIRSVLRRSKPKENSDPVSYRIGQLLFEPGQHIIRAKEGARKLTEKEVALLEILCRQKGKLVNRNAMLREIWGKTDPFTARTMDVHLTRLRKHLALDPGVSITNIHGQGFILKDGHTAAD